VGLALGAHGRGGLWGAGDQPSGMSLGQGLVGPGGCSEILDCGQGGAALGAGRTVGLAGPDGRNTRHLMMSFFPTQSILDILIQININQKYITKVNLIIYTNLKRYNYL